MCGRFSQTTDLERLRRRFGLRGGDVKVEPHFNFSPGMDHPVVVGSPEGPMFRKMKWGLVPTWSGEGGAKLIINLRLETLRKGSFRSLLKRRCLVPADSFYEWRRAGKMKIPVRFQLKSEDLFAFPGLYEEPNEKGPPLPTFTIFTTEPNALVKTVHPRMPVILRPQDESAWLDPKEPAERLLARLGPYPESEMKAYDVSPALNSGAADSPDLVKPFTLPIPKQGELPL
jgi:putative SOS response-associated peptidase YedK